MNKKLRILILLALAGIALWQLSTIAAGTNGTQLIRAMVAGNTSNHSPAKALADKPKVEGLTETDTSPLSGINTAPEGINKPEEKSDDLKAAEAIKAEIEQAEALQRLTADVKTVGATIESSPIEEIGSDDPVTLMAQAIADRVVAGEEISSFDKETLSNYLERTGEPWPTPRNDGNPLDNVGGGDGTDYFFVDNVTPDTASYSWIELCDSTGTTDGPVGDDVASAALPLGFTFPFYGGNYTTCYITTNGLITFNASNTTLNASDPLTSAPTNPYIAPMWGDQYAALSGGCANTGVAPWIRWKSIGTGPDQYFVVEWRRNGEYHSGTAPTQWYSYEAILYPNGKVKVQFGPDAIFMPVVASHTWGVGIDAPGATNGVRYWFYNTAGPISLGITPAPGRAVWFYSYLYDHNYATTSITSPSGYYPTGTNVNVTARFTNRGIATESSPVKYSFNGGPVQEEATASLAQGAFEDHTFGAQITTPATPGTYVLTVYTDLTTDGARGNDTLRATITVGGGDCANAITLTTVGPDSMLLSNCGTGDTSPGQPCGLSGQDMVFRYDVPDGSQLVVWESANNTITGRHTLRWGGACPGDNFVDCSTTESRRMRFVNNTGSTQTAWITIGNTTTPGTCGLLGIGWQVTSCGPNAALIDGFETAAALPIFTNCWGMSNTLASTTMWENYSTSPRTGTRCASILGNVVGNDDWLFSPGVSLTNGNTYVMDFWWRGASTTVPESLEVMAGTSNTVAGMTQSVMAMDSIKRTVYMERTANFVAPSTATYYFGWHNVSKRSACRTYIDDVQIYPAGSCSAPSELVNSPTGQDSALMVATASGGYGGPIQYQWFTGSDCNEANIIVGATTASYYVHASGTYSCRAWIVDPNTCAFCASGVATVIDCSIPATVPWSEGFESTSGSAMPVCWTSAEFGGDNDGVRWTTSTSGPHTPSLRAAFCQWSSSSVTPNDWAFTPPLSLSAGTIYLLDFWAREDLTSSAYFDSLKVLLTTAPNNVSTVATVVPTFRLSTTTYGEVTGNFNLTQAGNYYLAFVYTGSSNAGGIFVDDISLSIGGTCTAPTVSVADSASIGTVTMFCNATGGSGGTMVYQWYTGQACIQANAIVGATNSTYLTTVNGDYACRAYRLDSTLCAACDWGTATVTPAPPGYDCSNAIVLTTTSADSAQYNNCNMGNNSPGQSCGNSANDMVFMMVVPAGNSASIYQYFNDFDSRHSLRWGGNCPGDNLVGCIDDDDYTQYSWTNCTGSAQNLYFVVGYYSTSNTCGNFRLRWINTPPCANVVCTPTVTESGNNGGCGGDLAFNSIVCGDVISGNVIANTSTRDVDAYELTLAQPQNLVLTALSEFDAILEVRTAAIGTPCPDVLLQSINSLGSCAGETRTLFEVPAGLVHITITAPFVELCEAENYCLTVTCEPPTSPPGESCTNPYPLAIPAAQGDSVVVSGNLADYVLNVVDTCDYIANGPDVFYAFTLTGCTRLEFECDDGAETSGDMHLAVYESGQCGINALLCDDDRSYYDTVYWEDPLKRGSYSLTSFIAAELPAGSYAIRVGHFGTSTSTYRLTVWNAGSCACDIACSGGDQIEAAENLYDPIFEDVDPNGGCNSVPPVYATILPGQTVCGVGFNYLTHSDATHNDYYRDTDWYTFSLTQPASMILTMDAEFRAQYGIISGPTSCPNPPFAILDTALGCELTTVNVDLNAGDYAMFVSPLAFVGNPLPSTYRATLRFACDPDTVADMTAYLANIDSDPTANDIRLKWTAQAGFDGVYDVYMNTTMDVFPGTWQQIGADITPVFGPNAMTFVHDDGAAGSQRRFYVVVSRCVSAAAASRAVPFVPESAK